MSKVYQFPLKSDPDLTRLERIQQIKDNLDRLAKLHKQLHDVLDELMQNEKKQDF